MFQLASNFNFQLSTTSQFQVINGKLAHIQSSMVCWCYAEQRKRMFGFQSNKYESLSLT